MVPILVAMTFGVAMLAKAVIHHPARRRRIVRVRPEREWMAISRAAMVPGGIRA